MSELKPCPSCGGEIRIFLHIYRGAVAKCQACKKEYGICGTDKIPTYNGIQIRKCTVDKIRRLWNRRVGCEPAGEYTASNRPKDGSWRVGEGEKDG